MDLVKMFEGLTPKQAKALTDRIQKAVENEYQNFKKGSNNTMDEYQELENKLSWLKLHIDQTERQQVKDFEDMLTRLRAGNTQPPPFDPDAEAAKLDQIEQRLVSDAQRLKQDPVRNQKALAELDQNFRTLEANRAKLNQVRELPGQVEAQAARETKIAEVTGQIGKLKNNPVANRAQLTQLDQELATLMDGG
jgi:hypothetical protein